MTDDNVITKSWLDGKMEPEAKYGCDTKSEAALVSLAVSMKRIADSLSSDGRRLGLLDKVYEAITND